MRSANGRGFEIEIDIDIDLKGGRGMLAGNAEVAFVIMLGGIAWSFGEL